MDFITELKRNVVTGHQVTREEAVVLYDMPLNPLCSAANELRTFFCSDLFDLCTIINVKSGTCPENCKYCAQSAFYCTGAEEYPLLDPETIVAEAKYNAKRGVLRYSIVASGRCVSDPEMNKICEAVKRIREETEVSVCISLGLLNEEQFRKLKDSGVSRVHNNLETSRNFFPNICTTHSFDDKVAAITAAKNAGLSVCSGGIMGLGESPTDRIDMALSLRELGIRSIPINILNPVKGTPLEGNRPLSEWDIQRIISVYRFILPDSFIRLAGGRSLLPDQGKACFTSGANAAISGDMLTTAGINVDTDRKLLRELNFRVGLCHE